VNNYQGPLELWTARETAERVRRPENWLAKQRCLGTGPTYVKMCGRVFYRPSDVLAWIESQRVESTLEAREKNRTAA
jgi:hypothetical protein